MIPLIVVVDGLPGAGSTSIRRLVVEKCNINHVPCVARTQAYWSMQDMIHEVLIKAPDNAVTIFDHFHYSYALRNMVRRQRRIPDALNDYADIVDILKSYHAICIMLGVDMQTLRKRTSQQWALAADEKTISRYIRLLTVPSHLMYHNPDLKSQMSIASMLFEQIKERMKDENRPS